MRVWVPKVDEGGAGWEAHVETGEFLADPVLPCTWVCTLLTLIAAVVVRSYVWHHVHLRMIQVQ